MEDKKIIISIGRECGSGGHEIGEKIAKHYGIKLYDKNILEMIAEQTNQSVDDLVKLEEKVTGKLVPSRKNGFAAQEGAIMNKYSKSDQLFLQEKAIILQLAQKESFVIVGRAANAILEGVPNTMRVYVYASDEFKVPRVKEYYHLDTDKDARKKMEQTDRQRRNYFHYYSDMVWGSSDGHDIMIDSSVYGIDEAVRIIIEMAERKFEVA